MTGLEPWVLFGDSIALSAHARYAADDDVVRGRALFVTCRDNALLLLRSASPGLDYPATGQLFFALGAWVLLRRPLLDKELPVEVALRLLALAHRFAYNRTLPTMMWERIVPAAEEAAPGALAEFEAQYRDRQPAGLLTEASRLTELLPG